MSISDWIASLSLFFKLASFSTDRLRAVTDARAHLLRIEDGLSPHFQSLHVSKELVLRLVSQYVDVVLTRELAFSDSNADSVVNRARLKTNQLIQEWRFRTDIPEEYIDLCAELAWACYRDQVLTGIEDLFGTRWSLLHNYVFDITVLRKAIDQKRSLVTLNVERMLKAIREGKPLSPCKAREPMIQCLSKLKKVSRNLAEAIADSSIEQTQVFVRKLVTLEKQTARLIPDDIVCERSFYVFKDELLTRLQDHYKGTKILT